MERVQRMQIRKENVIPFLIALSIALVFLSISIFLSNHTDVAWIVLGIELSILFLMVMIMAGFTVIKSLFRIGAGLSLLIFLAQSYCALPVHTQSGLGALKSLLGISLLYLSYDFCRSLYGALRKYHKKIKKQKKLLNEKWSWGEILLAALFLAFTGLFVWEIVAVVGPIIQGLCV